MIYKPFQDLSLSTLGMGNMRLPTVGAGGPIHRENAREIIQYAYENGVNYFDTAYRYHGGESERFVSEVLSQYPRDSWYLATKMPGHMMSYKDGKLGFQGYLAGENLSSPADIFQDQLQRCGVDYFDFYLLHNLCETSYDFYTDEDLRIVDYLFEQKKAGRIRHLGFSAHGRPETIENFLSWRGDFEFAQIQLNYLDWAIQDADKKYALLERRGIPVMVMEPCRGGRLAGFDQGTNAMLKAARPDLSIAAWAFRFLKALPGVQVVLSGMTTLDQLKDNLKTFSDPQSISEEEKLLLDKVVQTLVSLVPCTACRYCCEDCPQGLDIPKLITLYNELSFEASAVIGYTLNALTEAQLPSSCVACGACKKACPQGIDVPQVMEKLNKAIAQYKNKK